MMAHLDFLEHSTSICSDPILSTGRDYSILKSKIILRLGWSGVSNLHPISRKVNKTFSGNTMPRKIEIWLLLHIDRKSYMEIPIITYPFPLKDQIYSVTHISILYILERSN